MKNLFLFKICADPKYLKYAHTVRSILCRVCFGFTATFNVNAMNGDDTLLSILCTVCCGFAAISLEFAERLKKNEK